MLTLLFLINKQIHVLSSTSSATVRCISCKRCGDTQLWLDTWGPPGIWCRSGRSLECPQTAPHHSPHCVWTPLAVPGLGRWEHSSSWWRIFRIYFNGTLKLCPSSDNSLQLGCIQHCKLFEHKGMKSQNWIVLESHMTTRSRCQASTWTALFEKKYTI